MKSPKIFFGWWVVTACFLITLYTSGAVYFGFTAILAPIASEFGWSYTQISLAASLRGLEEGLLAPVMGTMADRFGPRRIAFGGAVITGFSLIFLSRTTSLATFYAAFALAAIGMSTCTGTVMITATANWFRKKIGVATGILASGFGMGGLLVPLVTFLVSSYDWRRAMVILGFSMWVLVVPLTLLLRHKPEAYGYQLDGEKSSELKNDMISLKNSDDEVHVGQALKNSAFWHIAITAAFHGLVLNGMITHVMPYLGSIGITNTVASFMAAATPIVSIGGRLAFGWLGDRFDKRTMSATGYLLMTLGFVLFGFIPALGGWALASSLVLFGIGWGSNVTLRFAIVREYFGRKSFGAIYGCIAGLMMAGHMVGAPLAGWAYDTWGRYEGIWFVFAALTVGAAYSIITTPRSLNRGEKSNVGTKRLEFKPDSGAGCRFSSKK